MNLLNFESDSILLGTADSMQNDGPTFEMPQLVMVFTWRTGTNLYQFGTATPCAINTNRK